MELSQDLRDLKPDLQSPNDLRRHHHELHSCVSFSTMNCTVSSMAALHDELLQLQHMTNNVVEIGDDEDLMKPDEIMEIEHENDVMENVVADMPGDDEDFDQAMDYAHPVDKTLDFDPAQLQALHQAS